MSDSLQEILPINIEQELKQSYLDYAMSVIVGRALPDVRDGLKPVHRRSLFAMRELGNDWNKPYKKSARIVGDVIGKYHPHGDTAVYDTLVRMAQPFSLRYMLADGQGNFGSVDGDSPAAMRYTEIRMSKIAHALLKDLEKETVDFTLNYDDTEKMPVVLPTRVPNLLANGSSGIAVGMATNIPPHNLREVINGCLELIKNPEMTIDELMEFIPGPDFPTAGSINGRAGIIEAYKTGRGRIKIRATSHIETNEKSGKESIVVTELPYQVNKARLTEKIAELVKDKRIEGISELRDESDKDGMRLVIDMRRGTVSEVLLNNLFAQTQMQVVFGINMVALDHGQPKLFNLKEMLTAFIHHRQEVVTRRTIFELRKARERAHILEGLGVALANIDEVIQLIKASANPAEAKKQLLAKTWLPGQVKDMVLRAGADASKPEGLSDDLGLVGENYQLSIAQVEAILELRLHRLTGLEQDKLMDEYRELLDKIAELLKILASVERLQEVIVEELEEVQAEFGDDRRTEITASSHDLTIEDLITEEEMVVTLSNEGYVKSQPLSEYQAQRRGGRGKSATAVKEEDFVKRLAIASTHHTMLCFSSKGKVYWSKVYEFPQAGRGSRGKPINNVFPLENDEFITTLLPVDNYDETKYVFMATKRGVVKKTSLEAFSRPRAMGIKAIEFAEEDALLGAALTDGSHDIMLFSNDGKCVRFSETDVRAMGRAARGVRGMLLTAEQKIISLIVAHSDQEEILTATVNGYGKRTPVEQYRKTSRGGKGIISIQVSERNGHVVDAVQVVDSDEVMLITDQGTLVRTRAAEVSLVSRNTQGVKLINLTKGEHLVGVQRIDLIDREDEEEVVEGEETENATEVEVKAEAETPKDDESQDSGNDDESV